MSILRRVSLTLLLSLLALPAAAQQNPVTVYSFGANVDTNTGAVSARTLRVAPVNDVGWLVQGMVAHDAVYSGNPLPLGCYASASAPSDVSANGDMVRMWCLRNGALSVNLTNSTVAVTQSGTWNINNVSGTVSLPTGAATAAKQPALGIAGSASADVITVQGIASGTAIAVSLSGNQAVNVAQINGVATTMGNGVSGTGVQRVTLASDSTGVVGLNAGSNLVGQVGRKNTFDAASTLTTTTNFTSLANGSGWSGGSITTTGCYDLRFRVLTKGSSASNTLNVDFFLSSAIAGETTMDDAASASTDQAFTAANRKNSRFAGTVLMNGTSAVQGSFSALDAFATLPGVLVPIAINSSGAALSSTAGDHVIKYECVR